MSGRTAVIKPIIPDVSREAYTQPPRFRARSAAIRNETLSPTARLLYLLLDDRAMTGGWCDATRAALADDVGVTVRSVARLIIELAIAHLIAVGRGRDWVRYTLAWASEEAREPAKPAFQRGQKRPPRRDIFVTPERTFLSPRIQGTRAHSLQVLQETPLTPQGGIDAMTLEGAYPGCEVCPACSGKRTIGRSEKRLRECGWCQGRGFLWPRREASA